MSTCVTSTAGRPVHGSTTGVAVTWWYVSAMCISARICCATPELDQPTSSHPAGAPSMPVAFLEGGAEPGRMPGSRAAAGSGGLVSAGPSAADSGVP
eukprot:334888-Chlamydomonas_euryale.AAC.1